MDQPIQISMNKQMKERLNMITCFYYMIVTLKDLIPAVLFSLQPESLCTFNFK